MLVLSHQLRLVLAAVVILGLLQEIHTLAVVVGVELHLEQQDRADQVVAEQVEQVQQLLEQMVLAVAAVELKLLAAGVEMV
jgi:hypothetical protein